MAEGLTGGREEETSSFEEEEEGRGGGDFSACRRWKRATVVFSGTGTCWGGRGRSLSRIAGIGDCGGEIKATFLWTSESEGKRSH